MSTRSFRNETFHDLRLEHETISGYNLEHCRFHGCCVGMFAYRRKPRAVVSECTATGCRIDGACHVGPAVFERCTIDDFVAPAGVLWLCGTAFHRCTFRGPLHNIIHFAHVDLLKPLTEEINAHFHNANRELYAGIDRAIDISEAECVNVEFRGIPAELVRTNPSTQIKGSYDRLKAVIDAGEAAELSEFQQIVVEGTIEGGEEYPINFVYATCEQDEDFNEYIQLFDWMRSREIALPEQR